MTTEILNFVECKGGCGTLVRPGTSFCGRCLDVHSELRVKGIVGDHILNRPGVRWWLEVGATGIGIVLVIITLGVPFVLGCRDLLRAAMGRWW